MSNPFAPPESRPAQRVELPRPASHGTRLVASLIDWALTAVIAVPYVVYLGNDLGMGDTVDTLVSLMHLAAQLTLSAVQWTWTVRHGKTAGKWLLGLKVVRIDGSPLDFVHGVVLRSWVPLLAAFLVGCFCGVWFAVYFVDGIACLFGDRRALHDFIAGTTVTDDDDVVVSA